MRKGISRILFTGGVTALVVGLAVTSSSASNTLVTWNVAPGGSIKTLTFATCTGPAKTAYTITASLPWSVSATAYDAAKGVTTMLIEGFHVTFSSAACSGTLAGPSTAPGVVKARYTNSTGGLRVLAAGATLKLSHLTGCAGLFQRGDAFTFATTFAVSTVQTITGIKIG